MSCHHTARVLDALELDGLGSLEAKLAEHITGCTACSAALTGRQLADLGVIDAPPAPGTEDVPRALDVFGGPGVDDAAVFAALGLGEMPLDVPSHELDFLQALVRVPDDAPYAGIPQPPPEPGYVLPGEIERTPGEAWPGEQADLERLAQAEQASALSHPVASIPPDEMIDPPVPVPLAPVAVSAPRRNWGAWLAGAGALAAAAVAFLVVYPMVIDRDGAIPSRPQLSAAREAPAKLSVGGPSEEEKVAAERAAIEKAVAERLAAERAAAQRAAAEKAAEDGAEDGAVDGAEKVAAAKPKSSRRARTRRSSPAPSAAKPAAPKPAARRPAARKPAAKKESTSEVDDLLGALDGSGGGSKSRAASPAAATPAPTGDPMLSEKLTRRQILTVVKRNARNITTCKEGTDASGTVPVEMVIGQAGRVTSAKVKSGPQKGTPVGSCIERKVRAFRFPQFSGDPMRIVMPFAL